MSRCSGDAASPVMDDAWFNVTREQQLFGGSICPMELLAATKSPDMRRHESSFSSSEELPPLDSCSCSHSTRSDREG